MPLVRSAKVVADDYVHVTDEAIVDDANVLVPAERFLAEADALLARSGRTGVVWPNNRDLDDLVPFLDGIAVVALLFPTFRDGRAYSQARLLRERFKYRASCARPGKFCATSSCSCCAPVSTPSK